VRVPVERDHGFWSKLGPTATALSVPAERPYQPIRLHRVIAVVRPKPARTFLVPGPPLFIPRLRNHVLLKLHHALHTQRCMEWRGASPRGATGCA